MNPCIELEESIYFEEEVWKLSLLQCAAHHWEVLCIQEELLLMHSEDLVILFWHLAPCNPQDGVIAEDSI